jgi:hypothetical protein
MSTNVQPAFDCAAAQVVAMGESRFGILWNGRLRAEEYPTQAFALLAIAALRRASMDGVPQVLPFATVSAVRQARP